MLVIGGYGVLLVVVALPLPKFAITFLILMIRQSCSVYSFLIVASRNYRHHLCNLDDFMILLIVVVFLLF